MRDWFRKILFLNFALCSNNWFIMETYKIQKISVLNDFKWDSETWGKVVPVEVENFRPESNGHRPQTSVKMLYTLGGFAVLFQVQDRYVRCSRNEHQDEVWKDSCVEFYLSPDLQQGYINLEFNCGGWCHASFIKDNEITEEGFKDFTLFTEEDLQRITIQHSLPKEIEEEIIEPTEWTLGFYVPFSLIGKYFENVEINDRTHWRGNFYKCGDETSHPHWASWSPIKRTDFHRPAEFGKISF